MAVPQNLLFQCYFLLIFVCASFRGCIWMEIISVVFFSPQACPEIWRQYHITVSIFTQTKDKD